MAEDDSSLESIGLLDGLSGDIGGTEASTSAYYTDNEYSDHSYNHSYNNGSSSYCESSAFNTYANTANGTTISGSVVTSPSTEGSKKVRFSKDVKAGRHGCEAGWYQLLLANLSELSLQKCNCGAGLDSLKNSLSEVPLCNCNIGEKRRCSHCGRCEDSEYDEENDLIWKRSSSSLAKSATAEINALKESCNAIMESRDAIIDSRDAILGSRDAMLECRDAVMSTRDTLLTYNDVTVQDRDNFGPVYCDETADEGDLRVVSPSERDSGIREDVYINDLTNLSQDNLQASNASALDAPSHTETREEPRSILKNKRSCDLNQATNSNEDEELRNTVTSINRRPTQTEDGRITHQVTASVIESSGKESDESKENTSLKVNRKRTKSSKKKRAMRMMKAPLRFMAHRLKSSRPKRVLAITSK